MWFQRGSFYIAYNKADKCVCSEFREWKLFYLVAHLYTNNRSMLTLESANVTITTGNEIMFFLD